MNKHSNSSYEFGHFRLDVAERRLLCNGKSVPVTQKAFEVLLELVERSGHLVEKDELMKKVWADSFVEEANLGQNIFILRKVLGETDSGDLKYIETVPRRGYRFIAPVTEVRDDVSHATAQPSGAPNPLNRNTRLKDEAINSLAVLPLVNVTTDQNAEYLSDGITESIINILSRLPQLRVLAHSATLRYKGLAADPQAAGNELGVRAVLTGKLLQLGDRLIIRTELVDVANGWQLWGEQYDREPSDILEVQEEIARKISDKLQLKLTHEEKERLARRHTDNTDAYHLYLRGRYFWNKYSDEWVIKGIECFEQAIATDPNYALAYAGLADSYHRLSTVRLSPIEGRSRAKAAALKAVKSDESLAEAHLSLGVIKLFYDYDWPGAEKEYKRALELNPRVSLAHLRYGAYLMYLGRLEDSEAEFRQALELDPLSLQINVILGTNLCLMGRFDDAVEQHLKTLELDQNYYPAHFCLGMAYTQQGKYEEAIAEFQQVSRLSDDACLPLAFIAYVYGVSDRRNAAVKVLKQLKERSRDTYVSPYFITIIYAGMGEIDQTLDWLEKSYEERSDWLVLLKVAPEFAHLRTNPRYCDLLKRVGLVE